MIIIHDGYARLQGMANRFGQVFENCDLGKVTSLGYIVTAAVSARIDPPVAGLFSAFMAVISFAILSNEIVAIGQAAADNIPRVVQSARQMWTGWFG